LTSDESDQEIKLKKDHYSFYAPIPKRIVMELSLHLQRELILDKTVDPNNPFNWEIRLRPKEAVLKEWKRKKKSSKTQ
jgi:hypothetical protein